MKMICIIFLMIAIFSAAFSFTAPVLIDTDLAGELIINSEKNIKIINNQPWLLYYDYLPYPNTTKLKIARKLPDNSFEIIELDEFYLNESNKIYLDCSFAVTGDCINIIYRTQDTYGNMENYQIHSDDNLLNWNIINSLSMYSGIQIFSLETVNNDQYLLMLRNQDDGHTEIYDLYYESNQGLEFDGSDELFGSVYAKDDIYIRNTMGGINSGWPLFHSFVATEGNIIDAESGLPAYLSAPMSDIFLGGWQENTNNEYTLPESNTIFDSNGFILYDSQSRDVLFMRIHRNTATCRYADYITHTDSLTVYNSFPSVDNNSIEIGDSIWTNEFDYSEIEWDLETFTISFNPYIGLKLFCDLWIEGIIEGELALTTTEDIYITDDILYYNTTPGENPSDNNIDLLWLNADKNIRIKYKNYDPYFGYLNCNNCDGVYIYGLLSALGMPVSPLPEDEHTAGGLRVEYLHPHGSEPGFDYVTTQNDTISILFPDLHKFVYYDIENFTGDQGFIMHSNDRPQNYPSCGFPYEDPDYGDGITTPYGTDFPQYNPVYPESSDDIYFYRGDIDLFGGLYERRSHEIYCNGYNSNYHNDNIWDPENNLFGGVHDECGYNLNIHTDSRLNDFPFFNWSQFFCEIGYDLTILKFENASEYFNQIYNFHWNDFSISRSQQLLTSINNQNITAIYPVNQLIRKSVFNIDNFAQQSVDTSFDFYGNLRSLSTDNETAYFCDNNQVYSWDFNLYSAASILTGIFNDFSYSGENRILWNANWLSNDLEFNFNFADQFWNVQETGGLILENPDEINNFNLQDINLVINNDQTGNLFLHTSEYWDESLYHSQVDLNEFTISNSYTIDYGLSINVFPYPVYSKNNRSSINTSITLSENHPADLMIYNCKGQLIKSMQINESGTYRIILNDTASGMYLMKLIDDHSQIYRKMCIIH